MLCYVQPPGLGKFMVNSNGWFSHRLPQRSQLRGYRSAASFSTGEPRIKSNPSHHQWASIHILDHRRENTVGFFASLSTPMPTPITYNFVAAVCRSRLTSSLARTSRGRGQPPQITSWSAIAELLKLRCPPARGNPRPPLAPYTPSEAPASAHCELAQRRQVCHQRREPGCRGSHDPLLA
jgi:hypothetical protein